MFSEHLMQPRGVNLGLSYLRKFAVGTLNVQPAHLHKSFFRRKARHVKKRKKKVESY